MLAHAFVIGGAATDSERCIETGVTPAADDALFAFKRGTVGSVPASVFAGVDYAALGHLHRRQAPAPSLRYSGSPLPYSFSEAGQRKGGWLIDLTADGLGEVRPVDLPVVRELAILRGELADILAGLDDHREHYLAFELTDARPTDRPDAPADRPVPVRGQARLAARGRRRRTLPAIRPRTPRSATRT